MTPDALKRNCEKKYGGQFSLQAWRTETMYAKYQEALFSASKLGGATVTVRAFPDGSMADNFLAVQYRAQTQEALAKLAEPIYGPVSVVNVPNRDVTESPPADTSFSSYIASRDSAVYCAVYTHADPARRNTDAQALRDAMEKARFLADIDLCYLPAGDSAASVPLRPLLRGRMELEDDYSLALLKWSEKDESAGS